MEMVIFILGVSCMSVLWVTSEPTNMLMQWFIKKELLTKGGFIHRLITCSLCFGLWLGFILYSLTWLFGSTFTSFMNLIYYASIIAVTSSYIDGKINNLN